MCRTAQWATFRPVDVCPFSPFHFPYFELNQGLHRSRLPHCNYIRIPTLLPLPRSYFWNIVPSMNLLPMSDLVLFYWSTELEMGTPGPYPGEMVCSGLYSCCDCLLRCYFDFVIYFTWNCLRWNSGRASGERGVSPKSWRTHWGEILSRLNNNLSWHIYFSRIINLNMSTHMIAGQ